MQGPVDVRTDVAEVAGLDGPAHTVASVVLPDPDRVPSPPVVAFGFPGGGYGRGYFTFDMPGSGYGGQAGYHASRHGWIFVACDHLGAGDSVVADPTRLTMEQVNAANRATVDHVMARLEAGSLAHDFPPVIHAIRLGIGQSMGGCLTISLQGSAPTFDGVASLGFSAIHTVPPFLSAEKLGASTEEMAKASRAIASSESFRATFHFADVPQEIVDADLTGYPSRGGDVPVWGSATGPGCAGRMVLPGIIAEEAAAIDVPVFVGVGEVDVVPDPRAEPGAYGRASDITVVVVPRMAHMHNFAGTRTLLWDRLASWGRGVRRGRRDPGPRGP